MNFEFKSKRLETLYTSGKGKYSNKVKKGFFKAVLAIKNASSENDLREQKRLHYHQLSGVRKGEWALNISEKVRLIVTHEGKGREKKFMIQKIEDYH